MPSDIGVVTDGKGGLTGDFYVSYIEWCRDYFVISDQEGLLREELWPVYCNLMDQVICVHLAMALYLMSYGGLLCRDNSIFVGTNPHAWLKKILDKIKKDPEKVYALEEVGMNVKYLRTHSIHKGLGTHMCPGCTVFPHCLCLLSCSVEYQVGERGLLSL